MMPTFKVTTPAGYAVSDCVSEEYGRRRIYLVGEITEAMASEICCQINQLAASDDADITLWIQSPGGSVTAGFAIMDTMATCGCDIRTVAMGCVASMGAVIASSGTKGKRYIAPHSEMMIHQALGGVSGQTADILRTASRIQKTNNTLYKILAENTGKSFQQISEDCDRDYFLDAGEAVAYGLADAIFTGFEQ